MSKPKLSVVAATEEATVPAPRKPYFNHEECTHPRTPAGRAVCRAARAKAMTTEEAVEVFENADAEPPAPKVKKAKKAKVAEAVATLWVAVRSVKGGLVTHWATPDGKPACGARIAEVEAINVEAVTGCIKCKARGPQVVA